MEQRAADAARERIGRCADGAENACTGLESSRGYQDKRLRACCGEAKNERIMG